MSVANRREFLLSSLSGAGAALWLSGPLQSVAWAEVIPGI